MELEAGISAILQAKSNTSVAVFDRGGMSSYYEQDYYTMYGNDANMLALNLFQTESVLKSIATPSDNTGESTGNQSYISVSRAQLIRVIRYVLLRMQYSLELYSKQDSVWTLAARGTAGNVAEFEDMLTSCDTMQQKGVIAAISIKNIGKSSTVSVACVDLNLLEMKVAEFQDSAHLPNLQSCIVQLGAYECAVASDQPISDDDPLEVALRRSNITVIRLKKNAFRVGDVAQDLTRLIKDSTATTQLVSDQSESVLACASALIGHLKLTADETNHGRLHFGVFTPGNLMRLDATAVDALELFTTEYFETQQYTIYSLLNRCRCAPGQKLLELWLRQPLTDINQINERLDVVEFLVNESSLRCALHDELLVRIPDLHNIAHKLIRQNATLTHIHQLYIVFCLLPTIKRQISDSITDEREAHVPAVNSLILTPIQDCIDSLCKLSDMVESTLDLNHLESAGELRVKPQFDENLLSLSDQIDSFTREANQQLAKTARELGLDPAKTIKLETGSSGFYFRVTKKEEKQLRGTSYQIVDSQKGGVRFTSKRLSAVSEEYVKQRQQYDAIQKDIIDHILNIAGGYIEPIRYLCSTIATIDVVCSLATVAATAPVPYVRPNMLPADDGRLELIGCRHPGIESRDQSSFIPNDVVLKGDATRMLIVTGPNMAGKSTYLRSTAISVLLAHVGSFVPCTSATVSVRDAIFTRIGAADNQMKGVSTFMAEMLDCAQICEAATQRSFVAVDELGRGTSTYDGFGLAYAIAEHLADVIGCQCLFATHFHELASLSNHSGHVTNVHVHAVIRDNQLVMMYNVKSGVSNQSFGIEVAKAVSFPQHVIQNASDKLSQLTEQDTHSLAALKRLAATDPTALRAAIQNMQ